MLGTKDRVRGLMAQKDELIVWLNKYKVSKIDLWGEMCVRNVNTKATGRSVKKLVEKVSSL